MAIVASKIAPVAFLLAAGSALADGDNDVFLDATYLAAPTEWCPAEEGVPVVVQMDGPDVIEGPAEWPRKIRVRRGGAAVEVDAIGEDIEANAPVIGRFSANFRGCQTPWTVPRVSGVWKLMNESGSVIETGEFTSGWSLAGQTLFRRVNRTSKSHFADLGDRVFYTAVEPEIMTNQTFAAETDEEQSQ